jgi:hypothetical protein
VYPSRQGAEIGECVLGASLELGQGLRRQCRVAVELIARQASLGDQNHELLLDSVVKVTLKATSLGLLGTDESGARGSQLAGLHLQLDEAGIKLG